MNLNQALNSDLTTIWATVRSGFDWWRDELVSIIPASWLRWQGRNMRVLVFDDQAGIRDVETPSGGLGARGRAGVEATVLVDPAAVLVRDVALPAMSNTDLASMLELNAERYFPFPSRSLIIARASRSNHRGDDANLVSIAAMPVGRARTLADALERADVVPVAVRIACADHTPDPRFDFLPAMRAAQMVRPAGPGPKRWWTFVAALALLNVAVVIWRTSAEVEHLQGLVDAQQPAVAVAQRVASRIRAMDERARDAARRRDTSDPLAVMARASEAVPPGAWVQRYAWSGTSLRLTGYRSRDADVAGALRKVPTFSGVRSTQTDLTADTQTGLPFDIVLETKR